MEGVWELSVFGDVWKLIQPFRRSAGDHYVACSKTGLKEMREMSEIVQQIPDTLYKNTIFFPAYRTNITPSFSEKEH